MARSKLENETIDTGASLLQHDVAATVYNYYYVQRRAGSPGIITGSGIRSDEVLYVSNHLETWSESRCDHPSS